ncbi:hypothetical protein H0H81_001166 [Sphagnurus paluster]|uniref:Uncharacterized protein n=1 Tax=Sphagnurus paluster TaxID=117069 RepID=A0A9P7KN62_9AGAR|nr:hypothetical protein H0H81_001166 [Sphagnurus paluster]
MSRMTAAQVIALGEYLEPSFDPASLTVSQILGILGYHNVKYPTPYSKPKLVVIFNEEIKAKATKLKKERIKKENSIASEDGIVDGATGQPLRQPPPVARRASRRLSKAPVQEDDDDEPLPRPDPPKRRRSSAQPSLGGPSRRTTVTTRAALIEESEPEEELPVKKIGRGKKNSETAGAHARRVSVAAADDSGWEDNNIFQSGAESSSPARPSPVRTKAARKIAAPRKSRKSSSAPPQILFPSPPQAPSSPEDNRFSPPQSIFRPQFSPILPASTQPKLARNTPAPEHRLPLRSAQPRHYEDSGDELDVINGRLPMHDIPAIKEEGSQELIVEENNTQVGREAHLFEDDLPVRDSADSDHVSLAGSQHITLGNLTPRHQNLSQGSRGPVATSLRLASIFVGLLVAYATIIFKQESAAIGYCDTGTSPRKTTLSLSSSPAELAWKILTELLDGLPGLGSVALPSRCIEDPRRKRNIGVLGKAIESLLGQERGRRICTGGKVLEESIKDVDGGEANRWGLELESLRELMKKKTPSHLLPTFDDTFNEAIQQLIQWGGVIIGEDSKNHRYVAHKTANLTWDCVVTVKAREIWTEWRATVFGKQFTSLTILLERPSFFFMTAIALVTLSVLFGRARAAQKRLQNKRVADLVQIALDTLRNQELAHHIDPVTAPQPYLSSLQLRDLILQDEHSVASRSRLWDQVERVVEGNANVRANLQEIHGGDEMRVWRWVGSSSGGVRKQVQVEQDVELEGNA